MQIKKRFWRLGHKVPHEISCGESYQVCHRIHATRAMTVGKEYYDELVGFLRANGTVISINEEPFNMISGDSLELTLGPLNIDAAMLFKLRFGGEILKGELIWRKID